MNPETTKFIEHSLCSKVKPYTYTSDVFHFALKQRDTDLLELYNMVAGCIVILLYLSRKAIIPLNKNSTEWVIKIEIVNLIHTVIYHTIPNNNIFNTNFYSK